MDKDTLDRINKNLTAPIVTPIDITAKGVTVKISKNDQEVANTLLLLKEPSPKKNKPFRELACEDGEQSLETVQQASDGDVPDKNHPWQESWNHVTARPYSTLIMPSEPWIRSYYPKKLDDWEISALWDLENLSPELRDKTKQILLSGALLINSKGLDNCEVFIRMAKRMQPAKAVKFLQNHLNPYNIVVAYRNYRKGCDNDDRCMLLLDMVDPSRSTFDNDYYGRAPRLIQAPAKCPRAVLCRRSMRLERRARKHYSR